MKAKKGILITSIIILACELLPYFLDEVIIAVTPPLSGILSNFISDSSAKIISFIIILAVLIKFAISLKKMGNEGISLFSKKGELKEKRKYLGKKYRVFKGIQLSMFDYAYYHLYTSFILIFIFGDIAYRIFNQSYANPTLFIIYSAFIFFYFLRAITIFRDRNKEIIIMHENGVDVPKKGNFTWDELQVAQDNSESNNFAGFLLRLGYDQVQQIPQWLNGYTVLYKALYDKNVKGSKKDLNIYKASLKGYKHFRRKPTSIFNPRTNSISKNT